MQAILEKPCNKCREVKPLTEFYTDKRNLSGKGGICNTCMRLRKYSHTSGDSAEKRREADTDFQIGIALCCMYLGPGPKRLEDLAIFTGLTRERIRQIEFSALRKVRKRLEEQGVWHELMDQFLFDGKAETIGVGSNGWYERQHKRVNSSGC